MVPNSCDTINVPGSHVENYYALPIIPSQRIRDQVFFLHSLLIGASQKWRSDPPYFFDPISRTKFKIGSETPGFTFHREHEILHMKKESRIRCNLRTGEINENGFVEIWSNRLFFRFTIPEHRLNLQLDWYFLTTTEAWGRFGEGERGRKTEFTGIRT